MAGMEYLREREGSRPYATQTLRAPDTSTAGVAMGRALGSLGGALQDAAQAVGARDVLLADTEARDALLNYQRDRNDFMYGPNGVMNRRGANGQELLPQAREGLTALRDKHGAGLNPIARKLYDEKTEAAIVGDEEGVTRFSAQQTEAYITGGREATIASSVEAAGLAYNDPPQFERHVGEANAEIAALGELKGWAPEQIEAEQRKATSSAVMNQIVRTGATDPLAAKAILDSNRHRLSAEHQQTLDTGLQDAVATAQARAFISDYVGPPGGAPAARQGAAAQPGAAGAASPMAVAAPNGDYDAVDRQIFVKESGGGKWNAKNPKSSAAGPSQFLASTFVEQTKRLRAKGGAQWSVGMSDAQIAAVRMPKNAQEAAWEKEVYIDFRDDNIAAIKRAGAPVNAVTRYVMHHFGAGNGPAILRAFAQSPAAPLASVMKGFAEIASVNPWMRGASTPAELMDKTAGFIGADPRSAAGNFVDVQGATTAILAIQDPLVQQKAISQLNQMMALENNAKAALSEAAFTQAWQDYKVNGTTEVPLDLQLAMGPGKLASLQDTIAKENSGALVTDIATYEGLMNMASTDPAGFARKDLSYYYPNLTEADRRRFTDMQAATRGELQGEQRKQSDPMSLDLDANWKSVSDIVDLADFKTTGANAKQEDVKRRFNMRRQFEDWQRDFVEREKRHPNVVELQAAARDLVTPVVIKGSGVFGFGDTEGIFADVATLAPGQSVDFNVTVTDIPREERQSIVNQLQAEGVPVNTETVTEAYKTRLRLALQGGVDTADEIPAEARAQLQTRSDGSRRSDDEMTVLYNQWLVQRAQEAIQIDAAHSSDPPAFVPYLPPSMSPPGDEGAPASPVGTSPFGPGTSALDPPPSLGVISDEDGPVRPADMDYPFGS